MEKYNVSLGDDMIGLTKIASYGAHLQHYESEMPSRISLLRLLARNQEVMKQLEEFRVHGQGSVLHGIGSLLGSAIHSLASGGSLIIKTIGEGLCDTFHGVGDLDEKVVGSIANATSNVIGAGASGASEILDSIGDLYLAGSPIQGYFLGNKSGHYLNNLLLKSLFSDENNYEYI